MSENIPNMPGGALPPKPSEAAKVQPKKETVRINLPPKPTASPTVKLPMLPTGGAPTAAATPGAPPPPPRAAAPPPPPPTATGAPRPPAPPAPGATGSRVAGPPTAAKPAVAAPPPPPPSTTVKKPTPVGLAISPVDKALAVVAAVTSLAALGSVIYLGWFLTNQSAG